MLTRPIRKTKNRWEDDIRKDMKRLKIIKKNGLAASRIAIIGNYTLRRPTIEVVALKEEKDIRTSRAGVSKSRTLIRTGQLNFLR
jgi:hypothetical protein